jgi:formate--tetrahydrofolate ligase
MPSGSRPLIGSSNSKNSGSPSNAIAIPNLCLIPKEKSLAFFFPVLPNPTNSNNSGIFFSSAPYNIENLLKFTSNLVVVLNKFSTDTPEEIDEVRKVCEKMGVAFSISEAYLKGGIGAFALADKVRAICNQETNFKFLYETNMSIKDKIATICKEIYHAGSIVYTDKAVESINYINKIGESDLPVCIAKTQYSISDDPNKLGYPKDFEVTVRDVEVRTGSGFIVVYLGKILTMPGLPKVPNYEKIDLDEDGNIVGIF